MALVIMRNGFGVTLFQRQDGLCAIERVELTLFVDAQHLSRAHLDCHKVCDQRKFGAGTEDGAEAGAGARLID
jgi:hypothetical protein